MLHGTRTVLYARFSSDNQRSESIDAQVRAMTDYCKHNNLTIIHTSLDEAILTEWYCGKTIYHHKYHK